MSQPRQPGHLVFILVFAGLLALDLWSKHAAVQALGYEGAEHELWDGVFKLRLVYNSGMMWGMAQDVPGHFWVVIRGAVVIALLWMYATLDKRTRLSQIAFGLVTAGALGNIYDNVFQGADGLFTGEVRDFLHFYWFEFPTFNVADSCICIGAPLLLLVLWNHDRGKTREVAEPQGATP